MIAVIDSGSGGVNVIKEFLKHYKADFVYLVDNKNCPYGNKPKRALKEIILQNIDFLLKNYSIDFIIIGCNTASSILDYVDLEKIKCPVLKTYPNLKKLVNSCGNKLLFATKNTIKNSNYVKYFLLNYSDIKTLYIKNLPKLIDDKIADNCGIYSKNIKKILKKHLFFNKMLKKTNKKQNFVALGCTHFKHIKNDILKVFKNNAKFFYCEEQVALTSKLLIKKSKSNFKIDVVLTKKDDKLQNAIKAMF